LARAVHHRVHLNDGRVLHDPHHHGGHSKPPIRRHKR
jgi:hypothetical protein